MRTKASVIGDSEETFQNTLLPGNCIAIILLKIKKFIQVSSSGESGGVEELDL